MPPPDFSLFSEEEFGVIVDFLRPGLDEFVVWLNLNKLQMVYSLRYNLFLI